VSNNSQTVLLNGSGREKTDTLLLMRPVTVRFSPGLSASAQPGIGISLDSKFDRHISRFSMRTVTVGEFI